MGVMSSHVNTVCNLGIEHDQNCLWSASRVVSVIQPSTSNFNPGASIHDSQLNMLSESDWNPSRLNTSYQNRSSDHNSSNFNTLHLNTYDYNIPSNLNTSHLSTSSDCNNRALFFLPLFLVPTRVTFLIFLKQEKKVKNFFFIDPPGSR